MRQIELNEFKIHISQQNETFSARVLNSPVGETGNTPLDIDIESLCGDLQAFQNLTLDRAGQIRLGEKLFNSLFTGSIYRCYLESLSPAVTPRPKNCHLRIKLLIDPPILQKLPWELLHDNDKFLLNSPNLSLIRHHSLKQQLHQVPPPLRLLVVGASPKDKPFDLKSELDRLEAAVQPLVDMGLMHPLEILTETTLSALEDRVRFGPGYHFFHFIGHAKLNNGRGEILLLDEDGYAVSVEAERVAAILHLGRFQAGILCACDSASVGDNPWLGVASTLLQYGFWSVVGMQTALPVETGFIFNRAFYNAVSFYIQEIGSCPIDLCVARARRAVHSSQRIDRPDWAIPVTFSLSPNLELITYKQLRQLLDRSSSRFETSVNIAEVQTYLQTFAEKFRSLPPDIKPREIRFRRWGGADGFLLKKSRSVSTTELGKLLSPRRKAKGNFVLHGESSAIYDFSLSSTTNSAPQGGIKINSEILAYLIRCAEESLINLKSNPSSVQHIPILINLQPATDDNEVDLIEAIRRGLHAYGDWHPSPSVVKDLLRSGKLLIVFNGLDEIRKNAEWYQRLIEHLSRHRRRHQYIITSLNTSAIWRNLCEEAYTEAFELILGNSTTKSSPLLTPSEDPSDNKNDQISLLDPKLTVLEKELGRHGIKDMPTPELISGLGQLAYEMTIQDLDPWPVDEEDTIPESSFIIKLPDLKNKKDFNSQTALNILQFDQNNRNLRFQSTRLQSLFCSFFLLEIDSPDIYYKEIVENALTNDRWSDTLVFLSRIMTNPQKLFGHLLLPETEVVSIRRTALAARCLVEGAIVDEVTRFNLSTSLQKLAHQDLR